MTIFSVRIRLRRKNRRSLSKDVIYLERRVNRKTVTTINLSTSKKATLTHQKTDILENVNKCSHRNEKLRREDKLNVF